MRLKSRHLEHVYMRVGCTKYTYVESSSQHDGRHGSDECVAPLLHGLQGSQGHIAAHGEQGEGAGLSGGDDPHDGGRGLDLTGVLAIGIGPVLNAGGTEDCVGVWGVGEGREGREVLKGIIERRETHQPTRISRGQWIYVCACMYSLNGPETLALSVYEWVTTPPALIFSKLADKSPSTSKYSSGSSRSLSWTS